MRMSETTRSKDSRSKRASALAPESTYLLSHSPLMAATVNCSSSRIMGSSSTNRIRVLPEVFIVALVTQACFVTGLAGREKPFPEHCP